MGVFTFESEKTSTLPPATLYNAFVNKFHILFPKIVPNIQSVETLEGNGGPGTIIKITVLEDGKSKYGLRKVDAVDAANYAFHYSLVGGDSLPENVEKISFEDKLVEGANGGSIAKLKVQYHTKGDAPPPEEELKIGQVRGEKIFRAFEAYLLANPDSN